MLPDKSFEQCCRQTLSKLLASVSRRLSQKRPADAFLNFTTNVASMLLVFLKELSTALSTASEGSSVSTAISMYLSQNPQSALASILDKDEQDKKLKSVAEDFLKTFAEPESMGNLLRVFLRETLAGLALESVLLTCSQPSWINDWIIYLLEGDDVKLIDAIDASLPAREDIISGKSSDINLASDKAQDQGAQNVTTEVRSSMQGTGEDDRATEDARREVQRLSDLMALGADEDGHQEVLASSASSTDPMATPRSSQSDLPTSVHNINSNGGPKQSSSISTTTPISQAADPFIQFDQILQPSRANPQVMQSPALTLMGANVTIVDDGPQSENHIPKSKPNSTDYLLQVEPVSIHHPGWIVAKKYAQFEQLHEFVSKIAIISGVDDFHYKELPTWKNTTKASLRSRLEAYLKNVLSCGPLAECDATRRFLNKDQALAAKTAPGKGILSFPNPDSLQSIGKGVLGVLSNAPKGAAGGGKAIMEGVSGVFGGSRKPLPANLRREASDPPVPNVATQPTGVISCDRVNPEKTASSNGYLSSTVRTDQVASDTPCRGRTTDRTSNGSLMEEVNGVPNDARGAARSSTSSRASILSASPLAEVSFEAPVTDSVRTALTSSEQHQSTRSAQNPHTSTDSDELKPVGPPEKSDSTRDLGDDNISGSRRQYAPLTTEEAGVAIELMFAVVSELFSLTAVWGVRRTILHVRLLSPAGVMPRRCNIYLFMLDMTRLVTVHLPSLLTI